MSIAARLAILLAILAALAGLYWKGYTNGKKAVQAEWDAEKIVLQQAALEAQESNRLKSIALGKEAERIDRELQASKKARADSERLADDRLRDFNAALGRAASGETSATSGADAAGIERDILGRCGHAFIGMAKIADRLEEKVVGLQGYVANVCLK